MHNNYCLHTHSVLLLILVYYFLGEWITPTVTGDRPPPISEFTLTQVTNNSAVLFGGGTTNGASNNVYIIEFANTTVVSALVSIIN